MDINYIFDEDKTQFNKTLKYEFFGRRVEEMEVKELIILIQYLLQQKYFWEEYINGKI